MADEVANLLLKIASDQDDAERGIDALGKKLSDFDGEEATAEAKVDTDPGQKAVRELIVALENFAKQTATATADVDATSARATFAEVNQEVAALDGKKINIEVDVDKDKKAQVGIQAVAEALQGLLKQATIITLAGFAAQGIGALAGAFVGLAGAIAPASGALAALPGLMSVVLQGVGVLKLGLLGVGDSIKKAFGKSLTEATPATNNFTKFIKTLVPDIVHLKNIAQGPILRGLTDGIKSASGNMGVLNPIVRQTANAIGDLARGFGKFVGSPAFAKDLTTIGTRNVKLIDLLGHAAGDLGKALINIVVAAGPLITWLARLAAGWAQSASAATAAGRESGKLAGFFEKTRATLERLGSILGGVGRLLIAVGRAGQDFGNWMLDGIGKAVNSLADLAGSAKGQSGLKQFFDDLKPSVNEIGLLIVDIGKAFISLATQPGLTNLIHMLRTELLPALVSIVDTTTQKLGPALIHTFAQFVKLLAPFVGSSGPLILFVKGLGDIASVLAVIIGQVPGLSTALVALVGAAATFKASLLIGRFTGLTSLAKYLGIVKTAEEGATLASTRRRAGELLTAAAEKLRVAGMVILNGITAAYTAVTNTSILSNIRARAATIAATAVLAAQTAATTVATVATAAFGAVMAVVTSPIFLVVAAIVALIAIGYLLVKNWDTVKAALSAVWDFLKDAAAIAFGLVKRAAELGLLGPVPFIIARWGEVKDFLASVWNTISSVASTVWNAIKSVVTSAVNGTVNGVSSTFNSLMGTLSSLWTSIKSAASSAWEGIKGAITGAVTGALNFVKGLVGDFLDVGRSIVNKIGDGISAAAGAIRSAVSSVVHRGLDAVTDLAGTFRNAGEAIVNAIKDGILSAANAVYDAVKSVVQKAKNLLPGSEPKDPQSPLRRLGKSGQAIVENLAAGIPRGADKLTQVLAAELAALPIVNIAPMTTPAVTGSTYNITRNYNLPPGPGGGLEPTYAAAQLDNLLRNEGALR